MNAQFIKKKPNGTRIWEIGLYNTYARNNPFMIIPHFNDINNDGYGKITLKQVSVFNLIPSVSYIYKF